MKKDNMRLPRATVEQAREFDMLMEKYESYDYFHSDDDMDEISCRLNELQIGYDWSNSMFEDQNTGKKGVMDVTGKILVPARYDGFSFLGSYQVGHLLPKGAMKDGKYGFVAGDGSGEELTQFKYTFLEWDPYTGFYKACWGDETQKFGYITSRGLLFIPNVIDNSSEPSNNFVCLESDGKFGGLDIKTLHYVKPTFEKVVVKLGEEVVFYKDGLAGYVIEDTGEFITIQQFENEKHCADIIVYNSYL